ncbi:MAG: hypothetical protein LBU79_07320 [Planctomycetota bacterium]|jgi:hypothetical protein|nr:hypothetical protein [Planctomycetota bacterium]
MSSQVDIPSRVFTPKHRWKKNLVLFILVVVVFLAGGAIGAGLTVRHIRDSLAEDDATPEMLCHQITSRVSDAVSLTPAESEEIDRIVSRELADVLQQRSQLSNAIQTRINAMCEEICLVLGPERTAACGDWMTSRTSGGALFD